MYLEGSGTSRVAVGCKYIVSGQSLKDLRKLIHHHIPLFLEGLLKQHFDRIYCSLIFPLFHQGRSSGFARLILHGFNQIEP